MPLINTPSGNFNELLTIEHSEKNIAAFSNNGSLFFEQPLQTKSLEIVAAIAEKFILTLNPEHAVNIRMFYVVIPDIEELCVTHKITIAIHENASTTINRQQLQLLIDSIAEQNNNQFKFNQGIQNEKLVNIAKDIQKEFSGKHINTPVTITSNGEILSKICGTVPKPAAEPVSGENIEANVKISGVSTNGRSIQLTGDIQGVATFDVETLLDKVILATRNSFFGNYSRAKIKPTHKKNERLFYELIDIENFNQVKCIHTP